MLLRSILVLLWLTLALHYRHSASLRCHSSSFRYIPVLFLSISFHSGVILPRSDIFRYYSCLFRFIPASFQLVPLYSGTILVHFVSFRRHSTSFRYIPVLFLSISFHSGVIPPRSGIFRYIPSRSVPFLFLVTPINFLQ